MRELISTKSWWDSLAKVAGSALSDAAPQLSVSSANVRLPICNCGRIPSKKIYFGNEFFISKAIGWALRTLYRTNPPGFWAS